MLRQKTKGSFILQRLKNGMVTTADIFIDCMLVFFRHPCKGFPALLPYNKHFSLETFFANQKEKHAEQQRFYNLLMSLRRDGLIQRGDAKGTWLLSQKGAMVLKELSQKPEQRYPKQNTKEIIVISYDRHHIMKLHLYAQENKTCPLIRF